MRAATISLGSVLALAAVCLPVTAQTTPAEAENTREMTCSWPVRAGDTGQDLLDRFGANAEVGKREEQYGLVYDAVILWGDDPERRIDVVFADPELTDLGTVILADTATAWSFAGVSLGSAYSDLAAINSQPFEVIETLRAREYLVSNWQDGDLAAVEGGCKMGVILGEVPNRNVDPPVDLITYETRPSDNAALIEAAPSVAGIYVTYDD